MTTITTTTKDTEADTTTVTRAMAATQDTTTATTTVKDGVDMARAAMEATEVSKIKVQILWRIGFSEHCFARVIKQTEFSDYIIFALPTSVLFFLTIPHKFGFISYNTCSGFFLYIPDFLINLQWASSFSLFH